MSVYDLCRHFHIGNALSVEMIMRVCAREGVTSLQRDKESDPASDSRLTVTV